VPHKTLGIFFRQIAANQPWTDWIDHKDDVAELGGEGLIFLGGGDTPVFVFKYAA